MDLILDQPIQVSKKQYDQVKNTHDGYVFFRQDQQTGNYYIKVAFKSHLKAVALTLEKYK